MNSACLDRKFLKRNRPSLISTMVSLAPIPSSLISHLLSIISPSGQFKHLEHCLS